MGRCSRTIEADIVIGMSAAVVSSSSASVESGLGEGEDMVADLKCVDLVVVVLFLENRMICVVDEWKVRV